MIALLPPRGNSGPGYRDGHEPVMQAHPFIRTGRQGMWHRPRSAVKMAPLGNLLPERVSYRFWCGQHGSDRDAIYRDHPPLNDEPVCGTCEGRAFASGQLPSDTEYATLFTPRWQDKPNRCPGSREEALMVAVGSRVGKCLVCGALEPTRSSGSPYNPRWGLTNHPPGAELVEPCAFHGWSMLVNSNGSAVCHCAVRQS